MTTIEVGKWYRVRWPGGTESVACAGWVSSRRTLAHGADLAGKALVFHPAMCEPWTPRVGEYVRAVFAHGTRGEPRAVVAFDADEWLVTTSLVTGPVSAYEPCQPPASSPVPVVRAQAEATFGGVAYRLEVDGWPQTADPLLPGPPTPLTPEMLVQRRDDGHRCPRCGGPAYMGLGLTPPECVAPQCEPVTREPTVVECWLDSDGGVSLLGEPGDELIYRAYGRGVTMEHPIRSEAVRLWREAVGRRG